MPISRPASGWSAVPLPMKIRMKSPIGSAVNFPVAAALGEDTVNGSPVDVDAAAPTPTDDRPESRRVTANAVHANGAAAGTSPPLPVCNHASRPRPIPDTDPDSAAAALGAAVITGASPACVAAAAITGVDDVPGAVARSRTDCCGAAEAAGAEGVDATSAADGSGAVAGDDVPLPPDDGADDGSMTGLLRGTGTAAGDSELP